MSAPLSISITFALSAATLWLLLRTGLAWRLAVDTPNARSLHARVTPRVGGLAFMPWALLAWAWSVPFMLPALIAAGLMVVSFLDDRYKLPVAMRFLMHIAAAGAMVMAYSSGIGWFEVLLLTLALGWMTNLYNFMDGMDGFAGGMAVFGFGIYAAAAAMAGASDFAVANACIAAGAAAFLLFNFPPARTFMGDVGSIPLGFLAGACGLMGWAQGLWPAWFPLLVFSPFVVDASVTLLRRLMRRERFWQAHREHYYQRLVAAGWGHRKTVLAEYALIGVVDGLALVLREQAGPIQAIALFGITLAYLAIMVWVGRYCEFRKAMNETAG